MIKQIDPHCPICNTESNYNIYVFYYECNKCKSNYKTEKFYFSDSRVILSFRGKRISFNKSSGIIEFYSKKTEFTQIVNNMTNDMIRNIINDLDAFVNLNLLFK